MREAIHRDGLYDSRMDNARSVEKLYAAHARLVRSVCRSLLRDREEADDALQQTFLSAQRALANGSSPREPAAWLATIARNECFARVRERMREPLPVDAEPTEFGADAYAAAVSRYEVATLREALADLPRAQREAILLRELRGLSYDEVARALSVTTAAVESLIFRARRTLQGRLSEALPALSPVALLARLFGCGGGDSIAPAVAKVAAVGVGATIIAGGAALSPRAVKHAVAKAPPAHVQATPAHIRSPVRHEAVEHRLAEHETAIAENASSSDVAASWSHKTENVASSDVAASSSHETEKETAPVTAVPSPQSTHESRDDSAEFSSVSDVSDDSGETGD